jgi:hypothetical protein
MLRNLPLYGDGGSPPAYGAPSMKSSVTDWLRFGKRFFLSVARVSVEQLRRDHRVKRAIAAAVILAVILSASGLIGVYFGFLTPTPIGVPPPVAVPFSEASAKGQAVLQSFGHGNWTFVAAGGAQSLAPIDANVTSLVTQGCTLAPLPQGQVRYLVQASAQSTPIGSSGSDYLWVLYFRNDTYDLAVVTVLNGTAMITGLATASALCMPDFGFMVPPNETAVDSPDAIAAAMSNGGRAFIAQNPNSNLSMVLMPGFSDIWGWRGPPFWFVQFSTCPAFGQQAQLPSQPTLNVTVDAVSGRIISEEGGLAPCLSLSPWTLAIGQTVWLGDVHSAVHSGQYSYAIEIRAAPGNTTPPFSPLRPTDLVLSVTSNGTNVTLPSNATAELFPQSGPAYADYSFSTGRWLFGGATNISATDYLALFVGPSLSGDTIRVIGISNHFGFEWLAVP